ncbi:ferrous iron transporter B [Arachnia propionica]|uniref:Ferrous iron transporter B n=1 Tax=Arachnia propionica TaxID=1750 RepID=A0A3P1WM14_9ACTN|nr:ferrous iron transporter B [Arachnia propionica]RRD47582.1 ferrous iron transporter B [Arachnia propionica]
MTCHDEPRPTAVGTAQRRFVLVGSPNCGKTTLFNALTGLRAKTGNYPGVTVSRYEGRHKHGDVDVMIEDLPGTYSLDAISPDEEVVARTLADGTAVDQPIDGHIVLIDSTQLRRGLGLLAQVQQIPRPTLVVLTFTDELARRGGSIDVEALSRAIGARVVPVAAGEKRGVAALSQALAEVDQWPAPVVAPPTDPEEVTAWTTSILETAKHRAPGTDERTQRIDAVLLHPIWGTLVFFVTMFAFFQVIFTVAAPIQEAFEGSMVWLGDIARENIPIDWLASLVADGIFAGVGGVVVFLPQIALLFLLISLLEGSGYLSRAAFLMDRVMGMAGLEGRAFVALLSSMACAIPGIMATRTLPSAKDRIATMMGAPLMTCSARLPVYVLLIGMLVPEDLKWGPFGAQGAIMFALYLLGAVSAMVAAWVFKRIVGRGGRTLPFYMEMPSYRLPSVRTVLLAVWDACKAFLRKVTGIIMLTTIALWALLSFPMHSEETMTAAGVDVADEAAVTAYTLDNSYAAAVGRFVSPVFEPLGFDWRVNVGVLSSLAAREVVVSTMGQLAAAEDPEDPGAALEQFTHSDGPHAGEPVFTPGTIAALLVFFVYALQCASTLGVMRRETGTWRWSVIAFGYMSVLAWGMAFLAKLIVGGLS